MTLSAMKLTGTFYAAKPDFNGSGQVFVQKRIDEMDSENGF